MMITPIWTMKISEIVERHEDLLVSADDIKELAKNEREKAIEELAEKLIRHFADWQMSEDDVQIKYIITQACEGVEEIAEQLKGE